MKIKHYMAPMEGLTGYIYRNAYHACYHPMDKYFTPFLSPKANSYLSSRELNDILPEHNQGSGPADTHKPGRGFYSDSKGITGVRIF